MTTPAYPIQERLRSYRDEIRAFILGEIEVLVQEMERTRKVPRDLWEQMAARDLLRLTLPAEYGGRGLRLSDYVPILEIVAQSHGSVRMIVHVHNGLWRLIHRYGTGHGLLRFEDCRVPADAILGHEGDGLRMVLRDFLDESRISIATSCVGMAQRSLDLAVQYARRRVTFGKPIAERQAIQFMLAEMALDVKAARLLVQDAARRVDEGYPCTTEAAMAKLYGLEMVGRVTDKALQVFGGIGYLKVHPIERIYRDARAVRFEEGTAEIQKLLIARDVLESAGGK